MMMAIIKASRADLLHKLDSKYRVYRKDGVLFRVPQIIKTGKPGKPPTEVFFSAFPQDRRLCVVNYLRNYERKITKYWKISKETFPSLNLMHLFPSPDGSRLLLL